MKKNLKITLAGIHREMVRDGRGGRTTTEGTLEVTVRTWDFFFLKKNEKPRSFILERE